MLFRFAHQGTITPLCSKRYCELPDKFFAFFWLLANSKLFFALRPLGLVPATALTALLCHDIRFADRENHPPKADDRTAEGAFCRNW